MDCSSRPLGIGERLAGVILHNRLHKTLRVTPPMAANVTDRIWSLEELVREELAAIELTPNSRASHSG
jgi:hypothetical protein